MAAPNSAQTRPSQSAKAAPRIQPNIACGPPAALTTSGIVMNGPTPIMSIMFSVVALASPTPRISSGCGAGLFWFMSDAQNVDIETNRTRHAERQLAKESVRVVHEIAFAIRGLQQATLSRLLSGVVRRQQGREVRIPRIHEVKSTFLHPAIEVVLRDLVGIVKDRILWIEDCDGSLLFRHANVT